MKPAVLCAALALAVWCAAPAAAHFVWIVSAPDAAGKVVPQVYFGEGPSPGEAFLLDKVAHTKAWRQSPGKEPQAIKLVKVAGEEVGSWKGDAGEASAAHYALCDYGVLDKGGKVFLLQYYAKQLTASPEQLKSLARTEALPLDVVPSLAGEKCTVTVLWNGKAAADCEIVLAAPDGKEEKLKSDAAGRATFAAAAAGNYALRARFVRDAAGERDGKKYASETHYCTLVLTVPGAAKAAKNAAVKEAADLLAAARDARALWNGFPGFRADVTVYAEGGAQKGDIVVSKDGKVELTGLKLENEKAVLMPLRSLVGHRLSDTAHTDDVSFGDAQTDHPLGRLIKLDYDTQMASEYRVKDAVITEVNRHTDDGRFTIAVLDVYRNPAGKYLPSHYTVNTWDKDGVLVSTQAVRDRWTRVGEWDLPQSHTSVRAGKGQNILLRIEFDGHELLK